MESREARTRELIAAARDASRDLFPGIEWGLEHDRLEFQISPALYLRWYVDGSGLFTAELQVWSMEGLAEIPFRRDAGAPRRVAGILRDVRETLLGQAVALQQALAEQPGPAKKAPTDPAALLAWAFPGFDVITDPEDRLAYVDLGLLRPCIWQAVLPDGAVPPVRKNRQNVLVPSPQGLMPAGWTLAVMTRMGRFLTRNYTRLAVLTEDEARAWVASVRVNLWKQEIEGILEACGVS